MGCAYTTLKLEDFYLNQGKFLNANGQIEAGNQVMIDRIQKIAKGELKASQTDINFMNHELTESELMKKGMSYEEAHAESLKKHGIKNDRDAEKQLYTQEVLDASNAEWEKEVLNKGSKKN